MTRWLQHLKEFFFGGIASDADCRRTASVVASRQSPDSLLQLLEENPDNEGEFLFRCCLLQELVVRGHDVSSSPVAQQFAQWMQARREPLAWLPFRLSDIEGELHEYLPQYSGRDATSWQMPFGPPLELQNPLETTGSYIRTRECTSPDSIALIQTAFLGWLEQSNGKVEVRIFRSERPLSEGDLSITFLQSLDLDCLARAGEVRAERILPKQAINVLFAAASMGGAYTRGNFGAYGRLMAWRSMAGLVGLGREQGLQQVSEAAEQCLWVSFDATAEWFDQVAWDVGLLAVRPDRTSIAALAATDTD